MPAPWEKDWGTEPVAAPPWEREWGEAAPASQGDAFENAALRTQRSVRPMGGRWGRPEGGLTEAAEAIPPAVASQLEAAGRHAKGLLTGELPPTPENVLPAAMMAVSPLSGARVAGVTGAVLKERSQLRKHLSEINAVVDRFMKIPAVKNAVRGYALVDPVTVLGAVLPAKKLLAYLSKPATAAPIAQWSKAYERFAQSGGPQSVAALKIATSNLQNSLGEDLKVEDLVNAAQDRGLEQKLSDEEQHMADTLKSLSAVAPKGVPWKSWRQSKNVEFRDEPQSPPRPRLGSEYHSYVNKIRGDPLTTDNPLAVEGGFNDIGYDPDIWPRTGKQSLMDEQFIQHGIMPKSERDNPRPGRIPEELGGGGSSEPRGISIYTRPKVKPPETSEIPKSSKLLTDRTADAPQYGKGVESKELPKIISEERLFSFKLPENKTGHMIVEPRGQTLYVRWIGDSKGTMDAANTFGPGRLRAIVRELRELFPGIKSISGMRVTGASGSDAVKTIPLR